MSAWNFHICTKPCFFLGNHATWHLKFALGKKGIYQSFPYENHSQFTKSSHQDRGPCCLHLPIFFIIHTLSSSAGRWKVVVVAVFLSKVYRRTLFNYICYRIILVWRLVSVWLTNATHHSPKLFICWLDAIRLVPSCET